MSLPRGFQRFYTLSAITLSFFCNFDRVWTSDLMLYLYG
jgi:hypothetical protein